MGEWPDGPDTGVIAGKLMLAGEYAVVHQATPAIAVALGSLVRWRLTADPGPPRLIMTAFGCTASQPMAGLEGPGLWQLARHVHGHLGTLKMAMGRSVELQVAGHIGGRKLGLGTSSAVTLSLLQAALCAAGRPLDPTWLMTQGLAIHGAAQGGRGSGYDIATQAWGGVIAYRQPPAQVEVLSWPGGLHGAALWTGTPADTTAALRRGVQHDQMTMKAVAARADALLSCWRRADVPAILAALTACEAAFAAMALAHPHLVPESARQLGALITGHGAVARTSGAGGGDCLLALSADEDAIDAIVADWQAAGGHCAGRLPEHVRFLEER